MDKNENVAALIRPLTTFDADLMIDFFASLSDQTLYFFTPHKIDPESLRQMIREIPDHPDYVRFMQYVVENGQEVMVGYVFFWKWHTKVPWFGIGLRDAYQGMGLGTQMMKFAVDLAEKHGKGGILLTTKKTNTRAQALYKKFGYEMIGEDFGGEYLLILRFKEGSQ